MTIKKTLAAAVLAAATLAAASSGANAGKVNFHFSIGMPNGGAIHFGNVGGYHPGPTKLSCWKGRKVVKNYGYKWVKKIECQGPVYTYKARKKIGGVFHKFRVRVNAWNGNIVQVVPI